MSGQIIPAGKKLHFRPGSAQPNEALGCNLSKCQMVLIRCNPFQIQVAAATFPCQVVDFPIKYLCLALSIKKLSRSALQPLVDKVADILPTWQGKLMHRSRLVLIKTTLSSILIYTSISIELSPWLLKCLIKLMKAFLWSETDEVQGGKCLVAWCRGQRPTDLGGGGLDVFDLKLLGVALCLKWLWLHRTDNSRSWPALPIQVDHTTQAFFKASVKCVVRDGKSILF
jgi:hypothetical protein